MNSYSNWKRKTIRFLSAQTISLFGSSLVQYAIIWHITLATSSGMAMTLATLCGYLPQIGISLFAGAWLDKYSRKVLMMLSDSIIAFATLLIAICFLSGFNDIWLLYVVLMIRSAGTGIQTPAVNAFLPDLVPKDKLMKVNGINSTLTAITTFLSPVLSASILAATSIEVTFFVDVITACIGVGIMFTIKESSTKKEAIESSSILDIKEGFTYLQKNPFLKHQIIYLFVIGFLVSPAAFLTPLLIERSFGGALWMLSLAQTLFSLGAILGGVLVSVWGGFKNRRTTILAATILYGSMMIGMGMSPVFSIFIVFNSLVGISLPCYSTPLNVSLQENTESNMLGRVFSMVQIASSCALPLGTVVFGPITDIFPVQVVLVISGLFVVVFASVYYVLYFSSKVREVA